MIVSEKMAKLPYYNIEEFGENPSPLNYILCLKERPK
jgi:hypothetical protein